MKNSILKNGKIKRLLLKNHYVVRNCANIILSVPNKVNLNAWIVPDSDNQNVGDYLSVIIVEYMCRHYGIDMNKQIKETKHLYAVDRFYWDIRMQQYGALVSDIMCQTIYLEK